MIQKSGLDFNQLSEQRLSEIAGSNDCKDISDQEIIDFVKIANALYRAGDPIISDHQYDHIFLQEFKLRQPNHPFLNSVEPEPPVFAGKTVALPVAMLSTEKAYTLEAVEKWLKRIDKAAGELNLDVTKLIYKATPKLDGFAAYDDGVMLYTRGDGRKGTDISRVFERGLKVGGQGKRGLGAGEIVVNQTYFKDYLASSFEKARNFQASIIKEKELDEHALKAIEQGAAVFYPFSQLPDWKGTATELMAQFDDFLKIKVDYDVDGVVIEATDQQLKQHLGSTRHHHRWQIAFKSNQEVAETEVIRVIPQTSRSGRVNPVAEMSPIKLSGAMISRATAHHYGMVKALGIGPGALIELTRSGLVIPKIERVIRSAEPQLEENCPSCSHALIWDKDYLYCPNTLKCPAQIENSIEHFFKTLGNIDGFGGKTIGKLYQGGIDSVFKVYSLTEDELINVGFGEKTSKNLLEQLRRSRLEPIEDWRFLGAFGIYRMGLGNCERLLQHHLLTDIFSLNKNEIIAIEGFADLTATAIVESLTDIKEDFFKIYDLGFKLIAIPLSTEQMGESDSTIAGKLIVFTGTMQRGSRDDMKKQAKQLGAKVATSVTSKTDVLVTGDKVGSTKIKAAQEKGVQVMSEDQYLTFLGF
ncbi:MAG: BRCT domain-containing protein [Methylococcaceae bacterium]